MRRQDLRRQFYFKDDSKTRSMLRSLEDEKKATGRSLSSLVAEALEEHVERRRVFVQQRLTQYAAEPKPMTPEQKARLERAMRLSTR